MRAIKEIKVNNSGGRKAILKEIEVLHLLNHPNLVKLIEIYDMKTKIYLVQDYLSGDQLLERIK